MNATMSFPVSATTSGGQVIVDMLGLVGNAVRRIAVRPAIASTAVVHPHCQDDLGDAFAEWADETAAWAEATFDAQAEIWPAY